MQKFVEATGKSIEDAVENAIAMLGVDRETTDVTIEIIDRPKPGFLGLGGTPAKVRAAIDAPSSVSERAVEFVTGLLARMGIEAEVTAETSEDGTIELTLTGERASALIGRRGETLTAIGHIAGYVANKDAETRSRVTVDAENYRKKREETLCKLAHRTAGKVVRMRKSITLEPMNAYERHVIHTALQEWRDVSTQSTGAEPRRAVVVSFTPGGGAAARAEQSGDRPPRRERSDRGPSRDRRDRPPRDSEPREQKPAEPLKAWEWE